MSDEWVVRGARQVLVTFRDGVQLRADTDLDAARGPFDTLLVPGARRERSRRPAGSRTYRARFTVVAGAAS